MTRGGWKVFTSAFNFDEEKPVSRKRGTRSKVRRPWEDKEERRPRLRSRGDEDFVDEDFDDDDDDDDDEDIEWDDDDDGDWEDDDYGNDDD